jgi:hypothetical protein
MGLEDVGIVVEVPTLWNSVSKTLVRITGASGGRCSTSQMQPTLLRLHWCRSIEYRVWQVLVVIVEEGVHLLRRVQIGTC